MSKIANHANINNFHHRVAWSFDENHFGRLAESSRPNLFVVALDQFNFHAPLRQDLGQHDIARAEHRGRGNDSIASLNQAGHRGKHRRHSGRGGKRSLRAFDSGDAPFEGGHGWVAEARIDEVLGFFFEGGFGLLGRVIGEARVQEKRFAGLAEARAG